MVALVALSVRQSSSGDLPRNISNYAHQVAASITLSCSVNQYCQTLTASIIPACERLGGAAGCWCGNHEAFYRCSVCVAGSTNNQTSQETTYPFQALEELCAAYAQSIQNSTAAPRTNLPIQTASASVTMGGSVATNTQNRSGVSGERKLPIGVIVGGVVGAIFGLLIVFIGVRVLAHSIAKNRTKESSRKNYYYKSVRYSDERSMNVHRSQTNYESPYEYITSRPVLGETPPDSTYIIESVDTPEPASESPPPYQSSTHPPHKYPPDRKSRAT